MEEEEFDSTPVETSIKSTEIRSSSKDPIYGLDLTYCSATFSLLYHKIIARAINANESVRQ